MSNPLSETPNSRMNAQQIVPETPSPTTRSSALNLRTIVLVFLMVLPAGLSHGPVFAGTIGYVAVFGGILLGSLVAIIGARFKWGILSTLSFLVVVYLIFGGAFALPSTTIFHVIPTLTTLQTLVVGAVNTWMNLLTLIPPINAFSDPTLMPLLSGMVCSFLAFTFALRPLPNPQNFFRRLTNVNNKKRATSTSPQARRPVVILGPIPRKTGRAIVIVPVVGLLALGILWGSHNAPAALWLGISLGVACLIWLSWCETQRRTSTGINVAVSRGTYSSAKIRTGLGIICTLVFTAVTAGLMVPYTGVGGERYVLRDYVVPPLDLQEYESPLAQYRHILKDLEKETMFTVKGMPEDGRLRIAAMDDYNGVVYNLAVDKGTNDGFHNVGEITTDAPLISGQKQSDIEVTVDRYKGAWIPTAGPLRKLVFTSSDSSAQSKGFHYSQELETALTTAELYSGVSYRASSVVTQSWSDQQLSGRNIIPQNLPTPRDLPDAAAVSVADIVKDASNPLEKIRAIERYLHNEGFYSDGKDGQSRPGHRANRIQLLLAQDAMIGDDEQYAVAMALMVRHLGLPARVVMGFYPDQAEADEINSAGVWEVKGSQVHAWVEVPFEGAGWVPFEPTPPRDKIPQTNEPKPRQTPKPQVLQPPEPPQVPAELPPESIGDDKDEDGPSTWLWWLVTIGEFVGLSFLLLLPFILILVMKVRRRKRRRRETDPIANAGGAWEEVLDKASDLGSRVTVGATRWEHAQELTQKFSVTKESTSEMSAGLKGMVPSPHLLAQAPAPYVLAAEIDATIYGGLPASGEQVEQTWSDTEKVIQIMKTSMPKWRWALAQINPRSLWNRKRLKRNGSKKKMRGNRGKPTEPIPPVNS